LFGGGPCLQAAIGRFAERAREFAAALAVLVGQTEISLENNAIYRNPRLSNIAQSRRQLVIWTVRVTQVLNRMRTRRADALTPDTALTDVA